MYYVNAAMIKNLELIVQQFRRVGSALSARVEIKLRGQQVTHPTQLIKLTVY
jgi:hypothetical protein